MRDRPQIRQMHSDHGSIRGVAKTLGASRNTVRRALAPGARDSYHRGSALDAYEPLVRDLLEEFPHMAVVDIAVVIDWPRSRQLLSNLVVRIRPGYIARAEATGLIPLSLNVPSMDSIETGSLRDVGTMTVGTMTATGKQTSDAQGVMPWASD